jgi:hypothetical protein
MAEFKVPTVALPAEVLSVEGRKLVGRVFVPAASARHSGAMRAHEWMEEAQPFFPFLPDGGQGSVILNKRQVVALSLPGATAEEEVEGGVDVTLRRVQVWCGDREFQGMLVIDMPESQSRVLDCLNRPGSFLGLSAGDRHLLIQKRLITRVQENPEG